MRKTTIVSTLSLLSFACADGAPRVEARRDAEAAPDLLAKADDGMAALCAWISEAPDGYCLADCVGVDPDCGGLTDACEANGHYGDGFCDRLCERPDPDCADEPPADPCLDEYRYADGVCDGDCAWQDPDCDRADDAPRESLEEWEVVVCARLNLDDPRVDLLEVASSLCIEREGEAQVDCIAHCVRAHREHQR